MEKGDLDFLPAILVFEVLNDGLDIVLDALLGPPNLEARVTLETEDFDVIGLSFLVFPVFVLLKLKVPELLFLNFLDALKAFNYELIDSLKGDGGASFGSKALTDAYGDLGFSFLSSIYNGFIFFRISSIS